MGGLIGGAVPIRGGLSAGGPTGAIAWAGAVIFGGGATGAIFSMGVKLLVVVPNGMVAAAGGVVPELSSFF